MSQPTDPVPRPQDQPAVEREGTAGGRQTPDEIRRFLFDVYLQERREDGGAQRSLMTLTSIAVAISAALFTFIQDHSTLLNDSPKPIAAALWLVLPPIPIGLVGWILYEAFRIRVRRGLLLHLEPLVARHMHELETGDDLLYDFPVGFRTLESLARRNSHKKRAHFAAFLTVVFGMLVFLLLFGGLITFFLVEAARATRPGSTAGVVACAILTAMYIVACVLALVVLAIIMRDHDGIFKRAARVTRGQSPNE